MIILEESPFLSLQPVCICEGEANIDISSGLLHKFGVTIYPNMKLLTCEFDFTLGLSCWESLNIITPLPSLNCCTVLAYVELQLTVFSLHLCRYGSIAFMFVPWLSSLLKYMFVRYTEMYTLLSHAPPSPIITKISCILNKIDLEKRP